MYCPNCGHEVKDSAKFCDKCGKEIDIVRKNSEPTNTTETQHTEERPHREPLSSKSKKTIIIVIAAVLVVALCGSMLYFFALRKPEEGVALRRGSISKDVITEDDIQTLISAEQPGLANMGYDIIGVADITYAFYMDSITSEDYYCLCIIYELENSYYLGVKSKFYWDAEDGETIHGYTLDDTTSVLGDYDIDLDIEKYYSNFTTSDRTLSQYGHLSTSHYTVA